MTPQDLITRLWWLTLARGLVTLGLGLVALFWPALTIAALLMVCLLYTSTPQSTKWTPCSASRAARPASPSTTVRAPTPR